jgi:ADP-ribose pyrophosphatase YjhB (NUDIX family)
MVVGSIPIWQEDILLCRRAIEPRYGKWTLPAGFLENGETVEAGAKRETLEEAGARIVELKPHALYNLAFINQVYIMFRATLTEPLFSAGHESLDVRLFKRHEVPWKELAFSAIHKTLQDYFDDLEKGRFSFHMDDIVQKWNH